MARTVRLAAARRDGDLDVLRTEVDRAFRTRRFLDYGDSMEWAQAGRPVVAALESVVRDALSLELVEQLQRAIGSGIAVAQR